jgi:large subunit ribosomal protein L24
MPKHVRKGDQVIVTSGDHKGQTGEVLDVITKTDRVLVKGINVRTKHVKPTQLNPQGGIVTKEMPIHISNVSPIAEGRATRVRFETKADGSKARIAVRGGKSLGQIRGSKQK